MGFFDIAGQIRLAQMVDNFWARRERKNLEADLEKLNSILEDDYHFGYLVKNDRVGYLRALAKTKYVFRGLDKNDPYEGLLVYKNGDYVYEGQINPDFMRTLEDFYYGEIRKKANIVDLKLYRYNALRDKKIENTINDPKVFTEEFAQNIFNTTREKMFEMVKRNEAVFAWCEQDKLWYIVDKSRYAKNVKLEILKEDYPLVLCA